MYRFAETGSLIENVWETQVCNSKNIGHFVKRQLAAYGQ